MPKPKKPIKAFRHKGEKRAHIPSAEEAGYESASAKVQGAPEQKDFARNPVVHRGQDPELYWLNKYGIDDREDQTSVDIRSLYRHEHIAPESIIKGLYRLVAKEDAQKPDLTGFTTDELFGNAIAHEELDKVSDYYTHSDGWTNRLMQGDSLLAMTSLLEREGMAGQVQCFYFDPPYGIKYGSNWQLRLNNRTVTDGQDDSLSGEPEQIKAFRDTWELGIHSYLSYLRDRLLVARELLHDSGSCFVQISDENVHLVRCLMDEAFGSANFVSLISYVTTSGIPGVRLSRAGDYLLWYAKDVPSLKYRQLFAEKRLGNDAAAEYRWVHLTDGTNRSLTADEMSGDKPLPPGARAFRYGPLTSPGYSEKGSQPFDYNGKVYSPGANNHWKVSAAGLRVLADKGLLLARANSLAYYLFLDSYPVIPINNNWIDTKWGFDAGDKAYVVQTNTKIIQRCLLMTTDPGDLVVDPTCGSGTTAFVAEQWGRRWITSDTSRIAVNIAKTRLMTGTFPYYQLYDQQTCDLRQGFIYKKVPHITLGSIANNEPPEEETLYDQPLEDKKRLRVAGPFTVETLQNYEPISPEELARQREAETELASFEDGIFEELRHAGVKTGDKQEAVKFTRIDRLSDARLHAEGWYVPAHKNGNGGQANEKKAYLYIGPKFGTVSKQAVNEAIKACRDKRDGDWLLILGFSFESGLQDITTRDFGSFRASIVRMHDDLLQQGLLKRVAKSASFVTIGEPDIRLKRSNATATVEIAGLDIYDPVKDEVKSRDVHDINYWMLDDNYDGSNFVVRQVFFCGGDKDEFGAWKKGLSNVALAATKKNAEQTLKIEIDDEAFAHVYGHVSRPFKVEKGQKIAVRVISQFGEETTKVLAVR